MSTRVIEPIRPVDIDIYKRGQTWESPGGMQFTLTSVTKKEFIVEVDRVVRKNGKQASETRTRVVPRAQFASFARPYERLLP